MPNNEESSFPKITIDQKVVVIIAVVALVVSYTVYLENRRLRAQLSQRNEVPEPRYETFNEVVIPTEPGTLTVEDIAPSSDIDEKIVKGD